MRRLAFLVAFAFVFALALSASPALGAITTVHVGSGGPTFTAPSVTINPGDTVHWMWDGSPHSVTSGANPPSANGQFGAPVQGTGAVYDQTFNQPGVYHYFCKVHYGSGMVGTVTVGDPAADPAPTAAFSASSNSPTAGQPVTFDAGSSSTLDGDKIDSYTWNFGDGSGSRTTGSPTVTHTFASAGPVNVTLTITDAGSATSALASSQLTVQPGASQPAGANPASLKQLHLGKKRLCAKKSPTCAHPRAPLRFVLSKASSVALVIKHHGHVVKHGSLSGKAGSNTFALRAAGLSPGRYVLTLTPAGGNATSTKFRVVV